MAKLSSQWLTENFIDFEYKKYTLLAYLKSVKNNFDEKRIYPDLSEVREHYLNSLSLHEKKALFQRLIPKKVNGVDWENLSLNYEQLVMNNDALNEIEDILDYALPRFQAAVSVGSEIYEEIDNEMIISPLGIIPLHKDEGYFFIYLSFSGETKVYQYRLSVYDSHKEKHPRLNTTFVDSFGKSFTNTFTNIKLQLIRENKTLPNPATYLIEAKSEYPLHESLLPIACKKVTRYICDGE